MEDYRCALCGKKLGMMGARGRSFGETVQILCAVCDKLFEDADESKRLKLMERMEKSEHLKDREKFVAALTATRAKIAEWNAKYVCCGRPMRYCGRWEFQLGSYTFLTGDLGNLLAGSREMSVFFCEDCGQYKFYAPKYVEKDGTASADSSDGTASAGEGPAQLEEPERCEPEKEEPRGWFGRRKKDRPQWEK